VALSLVGVGAGALVAPRPAAAQFGIVPDDPRAYAFIRAMGVRDLAFGLVFAVLLYARARELLAWSMLAVVPIAAVDFLLVTRDRRASGPTRASEQARVLHAAGAIALLVTAASLYAGR
jgi:hypothetical protein